MIELELEHAIELARQLARDAGAITRGARGHRTVEAKRLGKYQSPARGRGHERRRAMRARYGDRAVGNGLAVAIGDDHELASAGVEPRNTASRSGKPLGVIAVVRVVVPLARANAA